MVWTPCCLATASERVGWDAERRPEQRPENSLRWGEEELKRKVQNQGVKSRWFQRNESWKNSSENLYHAKREKVRFFRQKENRTRGESGRNEKQQKWDRGDFPLLNTLKRSTTVYTKIIMCHTFISYTNTKMCGSNSVKIRCGEKEHSIIVPLCKSR